MKIYPPGLIVPLMVELTKTPGTTLWVELPRMVMAGPTGSAVTKVKRMLKKDPKSMTKTNVFAAFLVNSAVLIAALCDFNYIKAAK